MEFLSTVAFALFAAGPLAAILLVHQMEAPLFQKYATSNDMTSGPRRIPAVRQEKRVEAPAGITAVRPA